MTKKEMIENLSKEECLSLINKYYSIRDILKSLLKVENPNEIYYKTFKSILEKYEIISEKLERARFSSPISRISSEDFKKIFFASTSVKECLSYFGLEEKGSNYKTLKRRCEKEGLDYAFLVNNPNKVFQTSKKYETKDMFFSNSKISTNAIKKRIIKENLLPYFCQKCKRPPLLINNKLETLVLDHINGINNDHRLENLQFVCGTCNLHLETTGSKNRKNKSFIPSFDNIKEKEEDLKQQRQIKILEKKTKKAQRDKPICSSCKKKSIQEDNKSGLCLSCLKEEKYTKYNINEIYIMVQKDGYKETAKIYGVTGNTVKKWLKKEGLNPLEKKNTENFLKMAFELQKFFLIEKKQLPSLTNNKDLFLFISSVREKNRIGTLKREEREILDGISLRILNPYNKDKKLKEKSLFFERFIKENKRMPKRTKTDKEEDMLSQWVYTSYRYNYKERISAIEALKEKYLISS